MFITMFNQIIHGHCNVNMICFINKQIITLCIPFRKWCTVFKCNICIIVCSYCYISFNKNKCIRIITKTWFNTFCLKFDKIVLVAFIFCCLIVYNIPFFVINLDSSYLESFNKFTIFCVSILCDTYRILSEIKSCYFWFFNNLLVGFFFVLIGTSKNASITAIN